MEKWMIVYLLPLEVWMDIYCFPWISRRKFGQIVDKIGSFKFAEHAQFYLHEWGKRKLAKFYFDEKGFYKYDYGDEDEPRFYLPIPQTPLPENIKYFGNIEIDYFDSRTIHFMATISPILTGVNIDLDTKCVEDSRTILTTLVPLLDSIHSLRCRGIALALVRQCFSRDQLAKLRVLKINYNYNGTYGDDEAAVQEKVHILMDWLAQPNGARLCELRLFPGFSRRLFNNNKFLEQFHTAICQQFLTANSPCTFAIAVNLTYPWMGKQSAEFHLENGIGEELHGEWTGPRTFQITRHPANCNREELKEWCREMAKESSHNRIKLCDLTIGRNDAAVQIGAPPANEEENVQQQPSCSSKQA